MTSNATKELISSETTTSQPAEGGLAGTKAETHVVYNLLLSPSRKAKALRLILSIPLVWLGIGTIRKVIISILNPGMAVQKDFVQEYVMARAVLSGANPYESVNGLALRFLGTPSQFPHPSPHPPTAVLLFWPLGTLNYGAALGLWLAMSLALLALSVWLLGRCFRARLRLLSAAAIAIMLIAWYPFGEDLGWGQLNIAMLALAVGGFLAFQRDRPGLAGMLIGMAVLVKVIYWPFALLFLVRREWRALGATVVTVVAGYALAAVTLGPPVILVYFLDVLPAVSTLYEGSINNASIWTVGTRLFSGTGSPMWQAYVAPPLIPSPGLATATSVILPLLVVLALCRLAPRMTFEGAFALFAVGVVLVSPLAWEHYLVLLVVPLAYVLSRLANAYFPRGPTNLALAVGTLLSLSPSYWALFAALLAGYRVAPSAGLGTSAPGITLPPAVALLSLGSTVAMLLLGALVVWLDLRVRRS